MTAEVSQPPASHVSVLGDHPGALAGALESALLAAASAEGRAMAITSLSLDYAAPAPSGSRLSTIATVDRATRTLVFARAAATLPDGSVVATASAVLRVLDGRDRART